MHTFLHIGVKMRVVNKCFLYQLRQYARPFLFQQPEFLYSRTCHFYQRIQMGSALVSPHHIFLKHLHRAIITVWHNTLQMVAAKGLHKSKREWQETCRVHSQNQYAQFLTCTKICTFFLEYNTMQSVRWLPIIWKHLCSQYGHSHFHSEMLQPIYQTTQHHIL